MLGFLPEEIASYAAVHSAHPYPWDLLREVMDYTQAHVPIPQMLTGPWEGMFLQTISRMLGARAVVEVGTYTGYSALCMAGGMAPQGRLHTIEVDKKHARIARRFFQKSPFSHQIVLHEGDALEILPSLSGPFDLAFVDADKENYPAYYALLQPLMRPGGVLLFDNALWSGKVLDPSDASSRGIHRLNEMVRRDAEVDNALIPLRDGIQMVVKK